MKKCAAQVNEEFGLDPHIASLIVKAADEVRFPFFFVCLFGNFFFFELNESG